MPIGSYANLYYIAKELEKKKPKSVLDLGIGFGMNGVLVRQYVDMGVLTKLDRTELHGVEIFQQYLNPVWELYDYTTIACIFDFISTSGPRYDFILLTDVIEHFEKKQGVQLLRRLPDLLNPDGIILISTPGVFVAQNAVHGNEYERHLSHWSAGDFPHGYETLKNGAPDRNGDETLIMKYVNI